MHVTLAWLYGVLAIASVFITAGMLRIWYDRRAEAMRPEPDPLLLVCWYAGMHGLGGSIWWSIRAWDAIMNRSLNLGSLPALILFSAILYVIGKAGLVFASSLNNKPSVRRMFLVFCVIWSAIVWLDVFFRL